MAVVSYYLAYLYCAVVSLWTVFLDSRLWKVVGVIGVVNIWCFGTGVAMGMA